MENKTMILNVDFNKGISYTPKTFVVGDYQTCELVFNTKQDISGLDLRVSFKLPDDTYAIHSATIESANQASLILPTGVLIEGKVDCQVALYEETKRLTNSVEFYYKVSGDFSETAVEASDNYPILTQLIEDVEAIELTDENRMLKETYDPDLIADDVFDMDNMKESSTKKILTDVERDKLATIEENAKDDQIASEVSYDNTTSELTSTDTQGAIDEIDSEVDSLKQRIIELENKLADITADDNIFVSK